MKKNYLYMLLVIVFFVLSACSSQGGASQSDLSDSSDSNSSNSESSDDKNGENIKLGVAYQNLQNEYIVEVQEAIQKRAEELGIELNEGDGQGEAANQINQVENFITQGVDVILINAQDKDGAAPAIEAAVNAGIPIITFITQVANQDLVTSHVGSNDVEAGKIEMEFMAEEIGGKGNIVIIHGPFGISAEVNRSEGIELVLEDYPDINILAEQTANWSRTEGLSLMENWLQTFDNIDAVVSQNDEMALGALEAIEAAGKAEEIKVIGIDAVPDALNAVEEGRLLGTVFQDAEGQGKTVVEVAEEVAKGGQVDKEHLIPFQLITSENVNEFK